MSTTTTHLIPNHYPDDFCCLVVPLGTVSTGVFKNDREVDMVVDSITILPGIDGEITDSIKFTIDDAAGEVVATHNLADGSSATSTTYNVARILKKGEVLFFVSDPQVTSVYVQLRIRSRVA